MSNLSDQIEYCYIKDLEKGPLSFDSSGLPLSFDAITPDWLTSVLCNTISGARVESLQLGEPDNGSSNRRKIYIHYNDVGQASELPTKVFCKASHDLGNRIVLGTLGALNSETIFYNKVRHLLKINAPIGYFAKYNSQSFNSLIILGDISDEVESFCTHNTQMNKKRVENQLGQLARLHGRFFESKELHAELATLGTWPEFFERTTRQIGLEESSNRGFIAAEEVIPSSLFSRYDEIWPKTVDSAIKHNELPQTLIHSDVHLKNWYVLPNDRMGLSDWQCCSRGHWSRDLAYTISTACSVENRRLWEKDLIAYYLQALKEQGVMAVSLNEAWRHYRQQLLSALCWWTITLTPTPGMPDMQPRDITLEFIRRISTAIDDLDALNVE